jgi:hypothetical protein
MVFASVNQRAICTINHQKLEKTMILTVFSIITADGIPDAGVAGDPHFLVTDAGVYACIDLDSEGDLISSWSYPESGDQAATRSSCMISLFWSCPEANLVGLHEADAEGSLAVVWAALGDLRRQGLNCPLTCC